MRSKPARRYGGGGSSGTPVGLRQALHGREVEGEGEGSRRGQWIGCPLRLLSIYIGGGMWPALAPPPREGVVAKEGRSALQAKWRALPFRVFHP